MTGGLPVRETVQTVMGCIAKTSRQEMYAGYYEVKGGVVSGPFSKRPKSPLTKDKEAQKDRKAIVKVEIRADGNPLVQVWL